MRVYRDICIKTEKAQEQDWDGTLATALQNNNHTQLSLLV